MKDDFGDGGSQITDDLFSATGRSSMKIICKKCECRNESAERLIEGLLRRIERNNVQYAAYLKLWFAQNYTKTWWQRMFGL